MFIELDSLNECKLSQVGGKAHNIAKMIDMGLPVPNGFVCPTPYTFSVSHRNGEYFGTNTPFAFALNGYIRSLAEKTSTTWTLPYGRPLVVSVRSGAPVSMPGMMDTILNIGLNRSNLDRFVESLDATRGFGLDCYRRLIQMYAVTVKGVDPQKFTEIYEAAKIYYNILDEEAYEVLANLFEEIYIEEVGESFPQSPSVQLLEACNAVYRSWFSKKAETYRDIEGISHQIGTAVTVQQMIFGNLDHSATGVAFTHDPNTGEKGIYGDFLKVAQGEDVVAGTHKVLPIKKMFEDIYLKDPGRELQSVMSKLLIKEKDILDIEFTIERQKLWILQYRIAKRSTRATIRTLIDMTRDGEISSEAATQKFLDMLPKVQTSKTEDNSELNYAGKGLGVTDGIAVGKIAIGHDEAERLINDGEPYVYVAKETSPDDTYPMKHSVGILTEKGGRLSHAAVVARGWDKPCVVSFDNMCVEHGIVTINELEYPSGTTIKINGETGEVWI